MKKMLIAMAAIAVIGMGAAVADGYWGCVADSIQTGADAGAQKANEYGISDSVTKKCKYCWRSHRWGSSRNYKL